MKKEMSRTPLSRVLNPFIMEFKDSVHNPIDIRSLFPAISVQLLSVGFIYSAMLILFSQTFSF